MVNHKSNVKGILKLINPEPSNCLEKKHAKTSDQELPTPEQVEKTEEINLDIQWSTHTNKRKSEVDIPILMMAWASEGYIRDWNDLHRAAGKIRGMAGISEDAWNVAQRVLSPAIAAAAIALIFDKHTNGEVKSPGGYLRGMVEKAQTGELHLDRSFYGRMSGQAA